MRPPLVRVLAPLPAVAVLAAFALSGRGPAGPDPDPQPPRSIRAAKAGAMPSDWFLLQRAWPHADVRPDAVRAAHAQARALRSVARGSGPGSWQPVGPTNVGGRIADLATHPTDPSTAWIGAASGGVFATTDGGTSWAPLFDDEASLSVGSVAVDPSDPQTLWVGTGEPNGGGGSVTYGGTGLYRSTNGGATWEPRGLEDTRFIGRVRVDPANPARILVAALGAMWSKNSERGVYRSTDAGGTWQHVLALNDSTGAVDLAIDPNDSQRIFAAMWERTRGPDFLNYGGPDGGLFRSTDGGDTWNELGGGLPTGSVGRIGVSVSASSPGTVYAIYADPDPGFFDGVYKSTDAGDTWVRTNDGALASMYSSFGWWFGNIRVDPANANRVFALGLDLYRTTDGGASWSFASGSMHVDHHAMDFAADGSIWEGNDGGLYRSTNGGTVWTKRDGLALTQFYTVEVDEQLPARRYGGTQDNGTNRTLTGGAADWTNVLGGDGFRCLVDPTDNAFVYAEWQYGNLRRSTNGGASFLNATSGLNGRKNWSMPVEFDPTNPSTLYAGTHTVHRSTNRAQSWTSISPDLTDGDGGINVTFGTITTIAVAPTDPSVIVAGTDDGNVWRTTDGGTSWLRIDAALPERWITRVAVAPADAATYWVGVSGFRWDEPAPHVFRTTDHGLTWEDRSGDLPEAPVNDVVPDPEDPATLFVGTDFGVYRSTDAGLSWHEPGTGLPNAPVTDLELHVPTRTLVAATYGRSMWTLDVTAPTDAPVAAAGGPTAPTLLAPSPNPAAGTAVAVEFVLPRAASVAVEVFDVAGRRVAALASGARPAGTHRVAWDARDDAGRRVPAGVYLVRLAGDGVTRVRKLTLLD